MLIKLVRHGRSIANAGEVDSTHYGDHRVVLTHEGIKQATEAGLEIINDCPKFYYNHWYDPNEAIANALIYCSPLTRTRQTLANILAMAPHPTDGKITVYEDPRIRESEWGYQQEPDHGDFVDTMRETHGKFYYRIRGGESPADCYDRVSAFIDSLWRQLERKKQRNVLIVSHGTTIRCFVMRWMKLTVEQFDNDILNPKNCQIITITDEKVPDGCEVQFTCGKWKAYGLRMSDQPRTVPFDYFAEESRA